MSDFPNAARQIALAHGDKHLTIESLQAGDILLCCPKVRWPHQKAISKVTDSPYTHAAIYLGGNEIAEALVQGGVQKNNLSSVFSGASHIGVLRSQAGFGPERAKLLHEFIDQVIAQGRPYALKGALAWKQTNRDFLSSQMEHIAKHYGEFKSNEEMAKSAYFCSALIVACFAAVGIIDRSAQVAYPPRAFAPGSLYADPTFGWHLGYLVPEGSGVPDDDPLYALMQWSDA
jgi:hypothetical protein